MKLTKLYLIAALSCLAVCAVCSSCSKLGMSPEDKVMISRATELAAAIVRIKRSTADYPGTLEEARAGMPPGSEWPVNPYNGEPIRDTGNPSFEGEKSVGNVCYNKVLRDEEVTNFSLVVFGRGGIIKSVGLQEVEMGKKEGGGPAGRGQLEPEASEDDAGL